MASEGSHKMASEEVFDVVIIGAGLAGLATAHYLLKKDPKMTVKILEARDRVGGRTLAKEVPVRGGKTDLFDFGAQWVGPTQDHVLKIVKELGVETFPQYCVGKKLMKIGGEPIKSFTQDRHTVGGWFAWAEYQYFLWKLDRLTPLVPMSDPYNSPLAYELEDLTVAAYAAKHLRTKAALDSVDQSVKAAFGTDASRLGMLFFLAYANASGGMRQLYGVQGTAQDTRFKRGTQEISKRLADVVGHEKILLSHAAKEITQTKEGEPVLVRFCHIDSTTNLPVEGEPLLAVRANRVVSAVPPNLLQKITFNPPLDSLKRFLCENLLMGHLYKFVVTFEKAFWRTRGYSGEVYSTGGGKLNVECSTDPLCECYDASSFDGAPAIVGFIAGRTAIEWMQKTKEERRDAVIKTLVPMLGPEFSDYIAYDDLMWGEDPWAGGCPVMYGTPGTLFAFPHIRKPHGSVHFAGTETATVWMGYMSGAVASGERAAWEVLAELRPHLLDQRERDAAAESRKQRGQFFAKPTSTMPRGLAIVTAAAAAAAAAAALAFW